MWAQLDHTEQLHLETAEKLILEYLPFYLGQIRPGGVPALTAQLRKIEDLSASASSIDDPCKTSEYQAQRLALGRMLKDDGGGSACGSGGSARGCAIWNTRLGIAFELFQNADDAIVQASEMAAYARAARNRFIVLVEEERCPFCIGDGRSMTSGPRDSTAGTRVPPRP